MHAGRQDNQRDKTPAYSLKAVFLIKHREFSSKELRNCAGEWDSTQGRIIQTTFHSLATPLPQVCNPWVTSVSLRNKSKIPISFFPPYSFALLNMTRGCPAPQAETQIWDSLCPFTLKENWFADTLPVPEPTSAGIVAALGGKEGR